MSKSKKIIEAICTFETDCEMLNCVIVSVRKSSLPEVRACLPELIAARDRLNSVTFYKYFKDGE